MIFFGGTGGVQGVGGWGVGGNTYLHVHATLTRSYLPVHATLTRSYLHVHAALTRFFLACSCYAHV